MTRKHWACLLLPLAALACGCSMSGVRETLSKPLAALQPSERRLSPEFREAQKLFKDPERTLLSYARMKEDNEEYGEARERYRELTVAYPESVDARLGLARIEMATGRIEEAEQILQELAKQHPENVSIFMETGRMYANREEWSKAIAQFEKACSLKPEDQMARYELGLACIRTQQMDSAVQHLTFAVGESAAMYNIGYVLQEQGRTAEARDWYQKALDSHPDPRTALQSRQMLSKLNVTDEQAAALAAAAVPRSAQHPLSASVPRIAPRASQSAGLGSSGPASTRTVTASHASGLQPQRAYGSAVQTASWGTTSGPPVSAAVAHQPVAAPATAAAPAAAGTATYGIDQVPQWHGPATTARPETTGGHAPVMTAPAAVRQTVTVRQPSATPAPVQDPPAWRSRQ